MEKATPFDRPFFQKFYGIHDATDLFEDETVISHENRLFERSALHRDLPSSPKAALVSLRVTQDDSSAKHAGLRDAFGTERILEMALFSSRENWPAEPSSLLAIGTSSRCQRVCPRGPRPTNLHVGDLAVA
ncbi:MULTISPECIES: hypothetical protein [Mesorhizobium]|uniref:hypothetical protein n=1 Tax=Mesorhizobium TaxID=68287 RepID=UPI001FCD16B0|nr:MULTISPECIES: hypothetical protein [Mesorhizobium]MDF3233725.1 hypothetical protein [Mesorhizobium sp. DSM 30133]